MPDLLNDLKAMSKGWQVLIRGNLYYDQKEKQYYDANLQRMTYGEVASRYNFDPMKPQEIYAGTAQITPRTEAIRQWQVTGGERPAGLQWTPPVAEGAPQDELEILAARMGISVQDLLRYQYGVPVEEEAEEGLSAFQQAQIDLQREQQMLGFRQQREATKEAAYRWGQQRFTNQLRTGGGDIADAQRMQLAKDWRAWHNRLIASSPYPQSELLQMEHNPYERTPDSIIDEVQDVKREYLFAKQKADWFRKRAKDPNDPLSVMDFNAPENQAGQAAAGAFLAEHIAKEQYEGYFSDPEYQDAMEWKAGQEKSRATSRAAGWGADYGRDLPPKLPPPRPKTPEFLRTAYPELGERLPKQGEAPTPYPLSGQMWGRMLPSQKGKWAGYVSWATKKPEAAEDLYAQMQAMTPKYKKGVVWSPASQR